MEITGSSWKLGFQWNFRLENTFSRSWITFFTSSFAYSSVIKPITPEVKEMFPKRLLIRKPNFYTKYIFPNKTKNLNLSLLIFQLGFMLFVLFEEDLQNIEKPWNQWDYWYLISYIILEYKYTIKTIHAQ